jgi:hypothetical protein
MNRQLYQYHPASGYTFIPELRTRVMHEAGGYLLSSNAQGFRSCRDFQRAKGSFPRILLFGDSFTAGMGVSDSRRYGDLLEDRVGAEVFNFALPGTGTDQHYLIWKDIASQMDHDLVVIAVQVENIRRVNSRFRRFEDVSGNEIVLGKPYFDLDSEGKLAVHHYPAPKGVLSESGLSSEEARHLEKGGRFEGLRKMVNRMGLPVKEVLQRTFKPQPLPEYNSAHHPSWMLMQTVLEQWLSEIKGPKILFLMPLYSHIEELADPRPYQARFAELSAKTGVQIVNPLKHLRTFPAKERREFRFPVDIHPTAGLHQVLADYLATQLQSHLPS